MTASRENFRIRVAVVGFGFMGVVHAGNVLKSVNLELCGIIDNRGGDLFAGLEGTGNLGILGTPTAELRRVKVYTSLTECCNAQKIDACIIAVPLARHYEITREALLLGLNCLVEKPFCPTEAECAELIALAVARGKLLMVAHCVRFDQAWARLRRHIADKSLGTLKMLSTTRVGGEPNWGSWRDSGIRKSCGGSLFDMLIHDLDFINSFAPEPEDCQIGLRIGDFWEIHLRYREFRCSVKGGFLYRNTPFHAEYIAMFEQGSMCFSSKNSDVLFITTEQGCEKIPLPDNDPYETELSYFFSCVEQNREPEQCPAISAQKAIAMCTSIEAKSNGADHER